MTHWAFTSKRKEVLKKMSKAKTGIFGPNHNSWKGANALYGSKHDWIRNHLGHPKSCVCCKVIGKKSKQLDWANISLKYRRDTSDYISLCKRCHRNWDYGRLIFKINGTLYKRPILNKMVSGVTRSKKGWVSQTEWLGKHYYIGYSKTKEEAIKKTINFKRLLKPIEVNIENHR